MRHEFEKLIATIGGRIPAALASTHTFMGFKISNGQGGNGLGSRFYHSQLLRTTGACVDAGLKPTGGQVGKHGTGRDTFRETILVVLQGYYKGVSGVFFTSP